MHWHTYFATLARYNAWATRHLLDAVAAVPDEDYRRDAGLRSPCLALDFFDTRPVQASACLSRLA